MKKRIFITSIVFFCYMFSNAQNEEDAVRYSGINFGSTARSAGVAGAMGAVGSDVSSSSFNPAGLAVNRFSQFSTSLGLYNNNNTSTYIDKGSSERSTKLNFNIPNFGLLITSVQYKNKKPITENGWSNFNFGITFNRTNNFNRKISFSGNNKYSSITDAMEEKAKGKSQNDLNTDGFSPESLGFLSGLTYLNGVDSLSKDTVYAPFYKYGLTNPKRNFYQSGLSTIKGATKELNLSVAANYGYKLYFGASLGFSFLRYNYFSEFDETDSAKLSAYKSSSYTQNVQTSGTGYTLKLGAIYRLTQEFRVGFAYHTPTYYSLTDNYNSALSANWTDIGIQNFNSPQGQFSYNIITPAKYIFSVARVVEKKGFISVDYEILNYSTSIISADSFNFSAANKNISVLYKNGNNLRIGGELYIDKYFLRAGYANYGSPFKSEYTNNASRNYFTLGFGIHADTYDIDFAYTKLFTSDFSSPYTLADLSKFYSVNSSQNVTNFVVTYIGRF